MNFAKFAEAHRQIAIALQSLIEDLHMARTVHGLEAVLALFGKLHEEHVLAEGLEVT